MGDTYDLQIGHCLPAFKTVVSYKIYDDLNKKIIHKRRKSIICEYDNAVIKPGEINLLYGLEFDDLSEEVVKQIMIEKIKELATIDIKLFYSKWSDWSEIEIEIND